MNFSPPKWVTDAADEALKQVAPNHYSHPRGRIRLREAIKSFYGPQLNRDLDVESEILVTSGANEGTSDRVYYLFLYSIHLLDQVNILFSPHSWNRATK